MKKLFLALLFNLITLTAFSQNDFEGWWESKTSKYINQKKQKYICNTLV